MGWKGGKKSAISKDLLELKHVGITSNRQLKLVIFVYNTIFMIWST